MAGYGILRNSVDIKKIIERQKMLNERLKELRLQYGLSQQQVGDSVGLSKMAVSRHENGVSTPKRAILRKYAALFHCSVDDLQGCSQEVIRKQDLKAIQTHLMGLWLDLVAEMRVHFGNDATMMATERMLKIDTGKMTTSVRVPLHARVFNESDEEED